MNDSVPSPTVKNEVRQGGFTLNILAYRKLTREECMYVAAEWLRQNRKKSFPKTGSATAVTTFGFDE